MGILRDFWEEGEKEEVKNNLYFYTLHININLKLFDLNSNTR